MKKTKKSKDFELSIKEAQKDPEFIREVNKFIKVTSGNYKLKDYGLN